MPLTFRTSGDWGAGKGANLVAAEVDDNFWFLYELIISVQESAAAGVGIDFITQDTATSFTFHMTDHTTQGPFEIPLSVWNWTGEWQAANLYVVNDIFYYNATIYRVVYDHTSDTSFDPNAVDSGHALYSKMLELIGATVQTISADTWTPTLTDAFTYNRFTNAHACEITVPLDAAIPFPIGTEINGRQASTGVVTIVGDSGVIINSQYNCVDATEGEGSTFTVKKVDTDEWDLFGLLAVNSP